MSATSATEYQGRQSMSATSATEYYGRQSVSAKSTLDAMDALDRVCAELHGESAEDRDAAAPAGARQSEGARVSNRGGRSGGGKGVEDCSGRGDAGGGFRRTWALGPRPGSDIARAEVARDRAGRVSGPELVRGGWNLLYCQGAEEVVRQVLCGLERVGCGSSRGSSSSNAAADNADHADSADNILTADEVLESVLAELEDMHARAPPQVSWSAKRGAGTEPGSHWPPAASSAPHSQSEEAAATAHRLSPAMERSHWSAADSSAPHSKSEGAAVLATARRLSTAVERVSLRLKISRKANADPQYAVSVLLDVLQRISTSESAAAAPAPPLLGAATALAAEWNDALPEDDAFTTYPDGCNAAPASPSAGPSSRPTQYIIPSFIYDLNARPSTLNPDP